MRAHSLQDYFILAQNPDPYPPALDTYLNSIEPQIGAESEWQQTNGEVYTNFANTGDGCLLLVLSTFFSYSVR